MITEPPGTTAALASAHHSTELTGEPPSPASPLLDSHTLLSNAHRTRGGVYNAAQTEECTQERVCEHRGATGPTTAHGPEQSACQTLRKVPSQGHPEQPCPGTAPQPGVPAGSTHVACLKAASPPLRDPLLPRLSAVTPAPPTHRESPRSARFHTLSLKSSPLLPPVLLLSSSQMDTSRA